MRDWLLTALKTALSQKVPIALGTIAPFLVSGMLYLRQYLAPHLSDPTGLIALIAIAVSGTLLLLLAATYFWFRPKFKFMPKLGAFFEAKSGNYFCTHCLVKTKLNSPLTPDGTEWFCHVCNSRYREEHPQTPVTQKRRNPYAA